MERTLLLSIVRVQDDSAEAIPDWLAIEEPLEIRLAFQGRVQNQAVTMRTPGNDEELALGFLFTEGIISGVADLLTADPFFFTCSENRQNTVVVALKEGIEPNLRQAEGNFYTTSSCGVCGKASIEAIRTVSHTVVHSSERETIAGIEPAFIRHLPQRLDAEQAIGVVTQRAGQL